MTCQSLTPDDRTPPTLGQWLRAARESKRLIVRQIAALAAVDQANLGKVELNKRLAAATYGVNNPPNKF